MTRNHVNKGWIRLMAIMLVCLGFCQQSIAADAKKVMSADECGECHEKTVEAWRATHHYKTYKNMPRRKNAKKIAKKMGVKRMKKGSDCVSCHFQQGPKRGKIKSIAGISCESCHSPAKDWIEIHSDFGGKDVKKSQETKAHKKQRLAKLKAVGMIRPVDLYELANNCYQCHLVPNEKLVNVGGHKAGSDFELVSWSQGEVRHNYYRSKDGQTNSESSKPRKRMMYVVGHLLELEHSLRAMGNATQKATYAKKMAKRIDQARKQLNVINKKIKVSEIKSILSSANKVKLTLNNKKNAEAAANKISNLAKKIVQKYDGKQWAALDSQIPKKYKGSVYH